MKIGSIALGLFVSLTTVEAVETVKLGPLDVPPNKIVEFYATPNAKAQFEAGKASRQVPNVKGAVAVPQDFDPRKSWPLLIVSTPSGGSAIQAMRAYTNVALAEGWVVLAANGPAVAVNDDTSDWNWAMLSSVLDFVIKAWPESQKWPVACAGFSGGAKRSGFVGAALMRDHFQVAGLFMGGCNEDRATTGLLVHHPGDAYKRVPIFLSSGSTDAIASPQQHAAVKQAMERSGFNNVRLESYSGGHRLDNTQLRQALNWFVKPSANRRPVSGVSTNRIVK
jgi:hypothetical protein